MVGYVWAQAVWCSPADHHRGEMPSRALCPGKSKQGRARKGLISMTQSARPHVGERCNGLNPPLMTQRVPEWGTEVQSPH